MQSAGGSRSGPQHRPQHGLRQPEIPEDRVQARPSEHAGAAVHKEPAPDRERRVPCDCGAGRASRVEEFWFCIRRGGQRRFRR